MSAPIVTSGLSRSFGDETVVEELDLEVSEGSVHGFIGPSGSGKTTTVRMMTGVLKPSSGTVEVFGQDPTRLGTDDRRRIGYMPQLGVLYPELSIADNLRFVASLYGVRKPRRRMTEVLELLDMGGTQKMRLDSASGGMQRRVALAAVLQHDPQLLFLDEPTAGLDPVLRRRVWDHFRELREEGRTIFVTTQIVSEATSCDAVCLIADGQLLANGTPEELRRMAHGGEVVDLHTDSRIKGSVLGAVEEHELVTSASRTGADRQTLRIVVEDADAAIAALTALLAEHGVQVRLNERYVAPFDDIFVELLERPMEDVT
ncbi:ABC transporter ATP-binding protein [soil metagenome]